MKITALLSAALAAATLAGVGASATSAAPATAGDDVNRAVRWPNGKDVFVRVVKVPRMQATATSDCPMTHPAHCAQSKAAKPQAQG
jgi:hypothetical protein